MVLGYELGDRNLLDFAAEIRKISSMNLRDIPITLTKKIPHRGLQVTVQLVWNRENICHRIGQPFVIPKVNFATITKVQEVLSITLLINL